MKKFFAYSLLVLLCVFLISGGLIVGGGIYMLRSVRATMNYSVPSEVHLDKRRKHGWHPRNAADRTLASVIKGHEILEENPDFNACNSVCNESMMVSSNRREWMEFVVKYYESAGKEALTDPQLATFLLFCNAFEYFFPIDILQGLIGSDKEPSFYQDAALSLQMVWELKKVGAHFEENRELFRTKFGAIREFRRLNKSCLRQEISPKKAATQCKEQLTRAGI